MMTIPQSEHLGVHAGVVQLCGRSAVLEHGTPQKGDCLRWAEPILAARPARWDMMAVVPMYDPPRHDTKQTIEECIDKGIAVKMVTGERADSSAVAEFCMPCTCACKAMLLELSASMSVNEPFFTVIARLVHAYCVCCEPLLHACMPCIVDVLLEVMPAGSSGLHGAACRLASPSQAIHDAHLPADWLTGA